MTGIQSPLPEPRYELLRTGIQASWFSSPWPQGPVLCVLKPLAPGSSTVCSVGWAVFPALPISCAWGGGAVPCPAFPLKMLFQMHPW